MTDSSNDVSSETVRFHKIVETGTVDELRQALVKGVDVNAVDRCDRTALMVAVAAADLEKMRLLIDHGADLELADAFNRTALAHAVDGDFADGVRLLLSLGVDRGHHPKYPLKMIQRDFRWPNMQVPEELKELISKQQWEQSLRDIEDSLSERDQHPTVQPLISEVQSVEVLKRFLEAGDDLNLAPNDMKRAYIGLLEGGDFLSSPAEYHEHKSPCHGTTNPERMDYPFWRDMVRLGGNAYTARRHFDDTDPFRSPGAVWCFDRFGATLTPLPDGRFVQIAGEHEDSYDPDFAIYNDVVVHDGRGDFCIYGYPLDVFPPTDFHTATLVGDWIYIIGCLGYPDQRAEGWTPVFRLQLNSWRIEPIDTSGDMPGWLHGHCAQYDADRNVIRVAGGKLHAIREDGESTLNPNRHEFELDLATHRWRTLS